MPITRRAILLAPSLLALHPVASLAGDTPAPKEAFLYFISPLDGQRVRNGFLCRFGLRNMGVAPAGVAAPNAGHHHLLIDSDEPLDPAAPVPADRHHLHFGAGQTETRVDLPPGVHTLQLVLGDANHMLFTPPVMSQRIRVRVY